MYLDTNTCIKLNDHARSSFFESNREARQGDALNPLALGTSSFLSVRDKFINFARKKRVLQCG